MDLLTLTTGKPVCLETRSAVRWRVPCSSVGMDGSGSNWTAACRILVASASQMTAPSILASSRSRWAEKSTSNANPPVAMVSTMRSVPRTTKPPVLPRRMRSRPSRKVVPGATRAMAARSWLSTSEFFSVATGLSVTIPARLCVLGRLYRFQAARCEATWGLLACDNA